ncbi:MFS transporter [Vibrio alginolyticus]|uniref:MFS transporter n=1 Tax=Vibrio alginolyticus TaxID=663 RepID=UPI00215C1C0A|nr:MFS transporter [Vibrio alginolyticus]MCR9883871.1 MFS transporter [Vibrio alginolyticus]
MEKRISLSVLALVMFCVTYSVNLQAPLYSLYAENSNMGTAALTVAFAAYVLGLLPTLFLLGGISNKVGRKQPIFIALVLSVGATTLLVVQPNWNSLFIARLLLGVATALTTTSVSAYIYDLIDEEELKFGTLLVAASTSIGFGSGALATSTSLSVTGVTVLPYSYLSLFLLVPILMVLLSRLPTNQIIKPDLKIITSPCFPPNTWTYGLGMMMAWATTGMVIAIVPVLLSEIGFSDWTGMMVFLSICTGFFIQHNAKRIPSSVSLICGCFLTIIGFGLISFGYHQKSITIILIGASCTSLSSYGLTYMAALFKFTSNHSIDKARATAGMYIYSYIGFSIPVITSGLVAQRFGNWMAMMTFLSLLLAISFVIGFGKLIEIRNKKQAPLIKARN